MGEFLALLTAFLWGFAVIIFKKCVGRVRPFQLNLFKNCVAFVLLAATTIVIGHAHTAVGSARDLLIILTSGALGIGVSDTLFFMTLDRLGASRTALVDCLYSPFVIIFSLALLKEQLTLLAAVGGVLILGSVLLSSQRSFGDALTPKQFWTGCALGASAMATVALAIVIVKPLLNSYPLSWLSTVRMAGGIGVMLLLLPLHPDRKIVFAVFKPQPLWKWMLAGSFFGTYLSLVSWLAGFKYSQAGPVAMLNQTSTVVIVVLAALFLKEPMTKLKLVAVAIAFAGVVIIIS